MSMRHQRANKLPAVLVAAQLAVFAASCTPDSRPKVRVATKDVCNSGTLTSPTTDLITADRHAAYADLNCDGKSDTISVGWITDKAGTTRPQLVIRGAGFSAQELIAREGLPDIIAFGDLNADGIRDVLFAIVDESTIFPGILLVRQTSLEEVLADSETMRTLQYRWDSSRDASCLLELLPKMEPANGGNVVVISIGASWEGSCQAPSRRRLRLVDGHIEIISHLTEQDRIESRIETFPDRQMSA